MTLGAPKMRPVDQEEGARSRSEFYTKVARKDDAQMQAYWARMIFTGKGDPPTALMDDEEVIGLIAGDPQKIGYVDKDKVDSSVKVILQIP